MKVKVKILKTVIHNQNDIPGYESNIIPGIFPQNRRPSLLSECKYTRNTVFLV